MDIDGETEVYNDFQPPPDMLHRIDTSQSVKCFLKRRFSTTSSVYADNTIMSPDLGQIIFCLASVLQAQIAEDSMFPEDLKRRHPQFDLMPHLSPELGGVVEVTRDCLDADAPEDSDLRYKLENEMVPSVETIARYISMLAQSSKAEPETNIIALIYVNRLSSISQLVLTMLNWRAVWLTGLMLAQKMWNDHTVRTSAFVHLVPPLSKTDLRNLESKALQLIDFSTGVKPSLYAKYYFELRQLFTTIMGFSESEWLVQPLSRVQAKRLEALCNRTLSSSKYLSTPVTPVSDSKHEIKLPSGYLDHDADEVKKPATAAGTYRRKGRFIIS